MDQWLNFFIKDATSLNCLLELPEVQAFMKEQAYQDRKVERFRTGDELVIAKNPAFTLNDSEQRDLFTREYKKSSALYYQGQPEFDQLLDRIGKHLNLM